MTENLSRKSTGSMKGAIARITPLDHTLSRCLAGALLLASAAATNADERLRWAPPFDPASFDGTVYNVPVDGDTADFDAEEDVLVVMPAETVTGPVRVNGGRNVVMIGGAIKLSPPESPPAALHLEGWSGILHVEGVLIDPGGMPEDGTPNEPIEVDGEWMVDDRVLTDAIRVLSRQQGSIARFQNIHVKHVSGIYRWPNDENAPHGDIIQTWAGPALLQIHRLTGYTDYQGFYLAPMHFTQPEPVLPFEFYEVDLHWQLNAGYRLYVMSTQDNSDPKVPPPTPKTYQTHAVLHGYNNTGATAGDSTFRNADPAVPGESGGLNIHLEDFPEFVPEETVGLDYVSPGYLEATSSYIYDELLGWVYSYNGSHSGWLWAGTWDSWLYTEDLSGEAGAWVWIQ